MTTRMLRWPANVLLTTFVVQFIFVSYTFPLSEIFSKSELLRFDHGFHLYQILFAFDLAKVFSVVGYEPMFAAGHLGGVTFNASAKLPALIAVLLSGWLTPVQTYKLYVFIAAVIGPVCVPLAARWLGLAHRETWFATVFGFALWWVSAFHWYHTEGMVSFVLASYLSLPYFALIITSLQSGTGPKLSFMLGIVGAVCFLLHPLFPIPVALLTGIYILHAYRELKISMVVSRLLLIASLSVGANLIWILPTLQLPSYPDGTIVAEMNEVNVRILVTDLLGIWGSISMGAKVYPLLVICMLWGFFPVPKSNRRVILTTFVMGWMILELFAAVGAVIPSVGILQPNRFSATAYLCLVFPAALGVGNLLDQIAGHVLNFRKRIAQATVLFVGFATIFVAYEFRREISYEPVGHYGAIPPEVRGLGETGGAILDWIKTETSQDGRILFEVSNGRVHDESQIAGYLAHHSDREMIGGPAFRMFFAGFWDGQLFGKPIGEIPADQFRDYLQRYNIGWIVVHSDAAKRYLSTVLDVSATKILGPVRCYTVNQRLSYSFSRAANVVRQPNGHLLVRFEGSEGGEAILKYHYVHSLKAGGDATIEPTWVGDDPQPFILIRSGRSEVEIYE